MNWVIKYRPRKLEDIVGQDEAISKIRAWIKNWNNKGLLAYGPPGVGKTSTAYALANEYNLEVIELNASDFRNAENIKERLYNAGVNASLFSKGKLLLIDEVDGLSREDRGAISAIIEVIQKSKFPVYLTCNDNWSSNLIYLKPYVIEVEFKKPKTLDIVKLLAKIAKNEGISVERAVLIQLAGQRDVRSAILDFEAVARGRKKVTMEDLEVLGYRDRQKTIFEALRDIFKARSFWQAKLALMNLDKDLDEVMLWLDENIPIEYENKFDRIRAYEYLSRADVLKGRIIRRQNWGLMRYISDLITVGIAFSKKNMYRKFTAYKPPKYLQLMGKTKNTRAALNSLLSKIARYLHINKGEALMYLPIFKIMLEKKQQFPFELEKEELEVLRRY